MSRRSVSADFNQQIYEEACDWFVDMRMGDVDAAGRQRFDAWVRKSPEHLRAYLEVSEIWDDAPLVDSSAQLSSTDLIARARKAGADVVALNGAARTPTTAVRSPSAVRVRLRLAAAATIAFIAIAVGSLIGYEHWREPTYSTGIGEQRSVVLEDGSRAQLNSRTRLKVLFTERARHIELLEGQALFNVAKNPQRPFVVTSGDFSVRAVGTVFDVDRKQSGTTVTVLEGRVAVSSLAEMRPEIAPVPGIEVAPPQVFVDAGEQLRTNASSTAQPAPANVAAATAWTRGSLVLSGSRLGDVVEEFNRHNERPLIIADPSLAEMRISGVYASTDPTLLIEFLREQPALRVEERESSVVIGSR
ncbi:FecR domain-containing protein [Steroidobacter sp. S1-65]|uniref:FecR domain-containing protein n=1 Tax=Steroidobacter gossypii TaxID=2805490 RepID=A0ABS1X6L2_9GAMM|nr:FecR domain-containing protein [Steroidobacter gossypii]MBM0108866.1 FecR domain-containing protein [Steroidobacter gossypii]